MAYGNLQVGKGALRFASFLPCKLVELELSLENP